MAFEKPEGFIADEEFKPDEASDIDPQSSRALAGFTTVANTAPVQQALNVGQNLDNYDNMLKAAMAGDPQAQMAMAQHNAGIAMGSLKAPEPGSGIKLIDTAPQSTYTGGIKVIQPSTQPLGAVTNDIRQASTFAPSNGSVTTIQDIPAAPPNYGKIIMKPYAEGGAVEGFIPDDQFQADEQSREPAASAPQSPGFIPDSEFKSDEDQYGNLAQRALTGAEGVAKGLVSRPVVAGVENFLAKAGVKNVSPEDQRMREATNPGTSIAGEMAGLVAPALVTGGASAGLKSAADLTLGSQLGHLGEATAAAVGLGQKAIENSGILPKIGSAVVKGAIENMAFQAQDEAAKHMLKDPEQDLSSVAADIGLSGLIGAGAGAAFGSIAPLWKAASSNLTGGLLHAVADKVGGIEGVSNSDISRVIQKSGIELSPEIRANLEGIPSVRQAAKILEQTDTNASGKAYQEALIGFKKSLGDSIVASFGKTPEEVAAAPSLSTYEAGKSIGNTLADEYSEKLSPISKAYEDITNKYGKYPLLPDTITPTPEGNIKVQGTLSTITDKIAKAAEQEKWTLSPSSDIMREVNRVLKEVPNLKTVDDISGYVKQVGNNMQSDPMNGPLRRAGGIIKDVLKEAESDVVAKSIGAKEGDAAAQAFKDARAAYAGQSALKEAIDSRLHAGGTTSGFAKELRLMAQTDGEAVVRRLSGTGDADLLNTLQNNFPKTAQAIKDYHINSLLEKAADAAKEGHTINPATLVKGVNKMSPELQKFAIAPEASSQIHSVGTLLDKLTELPHNFSNTGRVAQGLFQGLLGSATGLAVGIATHSPLVGLIAGPLVKALGKDAPDAMRLATLKFLGSSKEISAPGFKAAFDFLQAAIKGESRLVKASKNIFKAGAEVLPASQLPTDADRKRLDKKLKEIQREPSSLEMVGQPLGHYMPDHSIKLASTVANGTGYLNSQRPEPQSSGGPLDKPVEPSPIQKAAYNRTLDIAQAPLIILNRVKEGTITPKDIIDLKTIYPGLYEKLSKQLTRDMVNHVSKGETVPYKTKMGLSLFLMQPMDGTMTPAAIQAAQPKAPQGQPETSVTPKSGPKHSTNALNKLPASYQTPDQARQQKALKQD